MSLTILACDSSKNQSGWCVATIHELREGVEVVYSTGTFKAKGETDAEVLHGWGRWWNELIELYNPDLIVFETPVIAQLNNMVLYQLTGILQYVAARQGVKILPVHNATLRSWHGAKGKPVAEARELLGLEPDTKLSDDESDAAFLAMIGCAYLTNGCELAEGDTHRKAIVARLWQTKADKAAQASNAKIEAGRREQAKRDAVTAKYALKAERKRLLEVKQAEAMRKRQEALVARELRAAETLRRRTGAAQRRQEREDRKAKK